MDVLVVVLEEAFFLLRSPGTYRSLDFPIGVFGGYNKANGAGRVRWGVRPSPFDHRKDSLGSILQLPHKLEIVPETLSCDRLSLARQSRECVRAKDRTNNLDCR